MLSLPDMIRDYQLVDQNVLFLSGMIIGSVEKKVLNKGAMVM